MKVLKTSNDEMDEKIISEAIDVLADGGVVLYPTDTVYGLGANIFDNKAVKRVFNLKQRSFLKPLSILVSDVNAINLVAKVSIAQKEIINSHLPGPYTFILNKRKIVPRVVTSGSMYVGVRVPDNQIACRLASIFPITTTSANISDEDVLSNPSEILEQLNCDVDLVIDVGDLKSNHASKIIDLTQRNPKIIRK
ncbi:L-threonylcarbamoyladenylate synthase [Methanobrevibacter sp.]|uniref:L-threonylcarbamoyladenylate synthase n=1 Tax=Methanobrevibacter sp. TaxID=66852 RepID=UPI0025CEA345|nr:L-threonylcarbamoyladenylate synthase [Methanobrevibacter sp.]MBQ2831776.1 threonylcarbamoyl-AMP synthase [Methanobrevibacter sp.]